MKKSPFQQLLREIENLVADHRLDCTLLEMEGKDYNRDFCTGYSVAINHVLQLAYMIYHRQCLPGWYLLADLSSPEVAAALLEDLKRGD